MATKKEPSGLIGYEMKSQRPTDRTKGLINYLKTKSELLGGKGELIVATLKFLERMDIDRRILFQEKIDILLSNKLENTEVINMPKLESEKRSG